MTISATGRLGKIKRRQRGFTLLEMMLILLLMGAAMQAWCCWPSPSRDDSGGADPGAGFEAQLRLSSSEVYKPVSF